MKIKTSLTNLAQILLIFFLFPIFSLICEALAPASSLSGLITFLGRVPLCEVIADILSQYSSGINAGNVAEITVWVFLKEFPTAVISGLSVHLCVGLFDFIWNPTKLEHRSFKPLPILPGFLGIFLASIISGLIGLSGSDLITFITEFGVIIIMLIGIKIMFSSLKLTNAFSITKILGWIIDGLYAVILSSYVASLMMVLQGRIANPGVAIGFCLVMAGITLASSLVVFFVRLAK